MKFLNAKYKAKKMVINFNHLLKEHIENESEQTPSHENAKSVITQPQAASNEKVQKSI